MNSFSIIDQTIPEKQKTESWHMDHIIGHVIMTCDDEDYNSQRLEIEKYFRAYEAELSDEEIELTKPITCPGGIDLGQEYIVYPLIQSKIEHVVGEFMIRPIRRKVYAIDKKSKSEKLNEKVNMLTEKIMREISKEISPDLGFEAETENPELELPDDIEEFFQKDYKMISEEVGEGLLRLFLDVNKQRLKFRDSFIHYAICDRAHAVLDKKEGHTYLRPIHPLDVETDLDPYKIVQDNHDYIYENFYLTENEIYNSFELNTEQKESVRTMFANLNGNDSDLNSSSKKYKGWLKSDSNKRNRVRAVVAKWKSRQRTSIKVSESKKVPGKKFYNKLKEDYKPRKTDVIKHIDKEVPRFCIMIGPDICLDYGIMKERYTRVDAKWSCFLPAVSIIRDNTVGTSKIKSIAAKLYPLQQMASEILFELRLAFKSAGDSRALVYDAAQMPKDFASTGGLNRVINHLKKDKLLIINSKDKGNNRNSFNQFTSLDLSQKGVANELIAGLAYIEDLASKFVGITPEREGQVGQYQTATGTDKAIRGSSARTEVIYSPFDDFIQAILEKAIMKMQHDYEEGEVIQYVFGEMKTKFMKIFKEFFAADLGVYLADSRKDKEMSERINAATELAMQGTNTPEMMMGLIEVFEGDNASEKKATFGRILKRLDQLRIENQKAAQEQAEAEAQAEKETRAEDIQIKREGFANNIDVAEIYKEGKSSDNLQNNATKEKIKAAELSAKNQENLIKNQ